MSDENMIEQRIHAIKNRLNTVDNYEFQYFITQTGDPDFEKLLDEIAKQNLLDAWVMILALFERYGDKTLYENVSQEFTLVKEKPLDSRLGYDDPYLIWLDRIRHLLDIFQETYLPQHEKPTGEKTEFDLLSFIRNMEIYITSVRDFGWLPCGEDDVHNRIEGALKCVFPDLKRKPPLAKPIKGFVPDTGLPSIKTLLEYKYICDEVTAKSVLDQILADIGGYQSKEYKSFLFVIYETIRIYTEDEWRRAIKESNPPNPVDIILLKGSTPTSSDKKSRELVYKKKDVE